MYQRKIVILQYWTIIIGSVSDRLALVVDLMWPECNDLLIISDKIISWQTNVHWQLWQQEDF